ncbi:hypothetical protein DIPPA_28236 [Diplonema papillatum]|nr:hypothetical protein DIPPA_28236 [Diplonema papillatum]
MMVLDRRVALCNGRAFTSQVGTDRQRFFLACGRSVSLLDAAMSVARDLGAPAVFCPCETPMGQLGRLRDSLRPVFRGAVPAGHVAVVSSPAGPLVFYEVALLLGETEASPRHADTWQWSQEYWDAFEQRDTAAMRARAGKASPEGRVAAFVRRADCRFFVGMICVRSRRKLYLPFKPTTS